MAAKPGFRDRLDPTRDYLQASRQRENDRIETEKRRQEAELQAAKEHAAVLRKRSRILRVVLAVTLVVAAAAVYGFTTATNARNQADARTREAVASKLTSQGEAMLAGVRRGGDVQALQQILAASRIAPTADPGAQLTALLARPYPAKIIETSAPVTDVAFSPDGTRIVSGSNDGTLRIWDAATGQQVGAPLTGHSLGVRSVAFSRDGHRIISGSIDKTARIWDAGTGQQIGHTSGVTGVAFSPDGRRIASGSYDKTLWIWPGPAVWPELLCAKLVTNMSHKQWRDWVSPDIDYVTACPDLPIAPD